MKTLAITALSIALTGCLSSATRLERVAPQLADGVDCTASDLRGQLRVGTVTGGKEQNPFIPPQVTNADFASVLGTGLATAGLFGSASPVDVEIFHTNEGFESRLKATYTFQHPAQGPIKFSTYAVFKATSDDAYTGVNKLRHANEKVLASNVSKFITHVCRGQFQPSP